MAETKRPTVPAAEEILGGYFPVLDHGFVSLVDYMGSDRAVEQAARVSYGQGTRKVSQTEGLLRYLLRHRHTTPFEMVEVKLHCAMPLFVARQWVRHRTASLNETSSRYSIMPMRFYSPKKWRLQSKSNRQGSRAENLCCKDHSNAHRMSRMAREAAEDQYNWLLGKDVARELARIDMPLSAYTQWYWKIDLHNLLHFLSLRADSHAQWEIQEYARVIAGMVKRIAPITFSAWLHYSFQSISLSSLERLALRRDLTDEQCRMTLGMGEREIREFRAKMQEPVRDESALNFDLDLNNMVSGEEMKRREPVQEA